MSTDRLQYLLDRLFSHELTRAEKEELALWADTLQNDEEWKNRLSTIWNSFEPEKEMDSAHADQMLKTILSEKEKQPERSKPPYYTPIRNGMMRWAVTAAAVVGILIILSLIFLNPRRERVPKQVAHQETAQKQEIMPGGNKAVLTLANGKKIILDSSGTGTLAQQGNTKIIKVNSGLLSYNQKQAANPSATPHRQPIIEYNTIATPRGGQYQIILPDGSKVWLNAASSLKFPTAFAGKERAVVVKGEVYLEVAKDTRMPFVVQVLSPDGQNKGTIKVLGTGFNINAYTENTVTTLVNGAVKIISGNEDKMLKPGEQATVGKSGIRINNEADINRIIAWKNGLFDFEGNSIREVMQQIALWYDIEVQYEKVPSAHFMGTISRKAPVSEVLRMLEMTGAVHFKIEGQTVIVAGGNSSGSGRR